MSDSEEQEAAAMPECQIQLRGGILSMPIWTYLTLHSMARGDVLRQSDMSQAGRTHVDALMNAGLVVSQGDGYSATEAGEQVVQAAICRVSSGRGPEGQPVRLDMREWGW